MKTIVDGIERDMTPEELAEWEERQQPVTDPVPDAVSMRQARLALLAAGKLTAIEQAINGMEDETQRAAARIEWDFAAMVERGSAFVALLGGAVGLTDEDTDNLFRAAIQL